MFYISIYVPFRIFLASHGKSVSEAAASSLQASHPKLPPWSSHFTGPRTIFLLSVWAWKDSESCVQEDELAPHSCDSFEDLSLGWHSASQMSLKMLRYGAAQWRTASYWLNIAGACEVFPAHNSWDEPWLSRELPLWTFCSLESLEVLWHAVAYGFRNRSAIRLVPPVSSEGDEARGQVEQNWQPIFLLCGMDMFFTRFI